MKVGIVKYGRAATYVLLMSVFTVTLALIAVGCKRTEPAPDSQADLLQAGDLFTEPVQNLRDVSPDAPAVKINDQIITRGQLDAEVSRLLSMAQQRLPPERIEQIKPRLIQQALDGLLLKTLLLQAVEAENVVVTDEEMAEAKDKFANSLPEGMSLETVLAMQNWTEEEFERNLRTDLAINKLLETHVKDTTEPTDKELQEYYDENLEQFDAPESVSARHILIATAQSDTEEQKAEKKAKAEEIRQKLLDGADFAELAKEYSDCPSKARGGDLGTFYRGQMVQAFEEAAFQQQPKEIGPVVETPFGYHIIEVLEHQQARKIGLEEVKERLAKGLFSQKRQRAAQEYVTQLRNKAQIEFLDPSLQSMLPTNPRMRAE